MKPKQREWEREFESLRLGRLDPDLFERVKEFIRQTLQAQHQQTLKVIEGMKKEYQEKGIGYCMACLPGEGCGCEINDYNQALDDLKARLEKE